MIIDEIETLHDIARGVSVAIPAAEYGNEMLHEVIERIACQLDSEKSIWQKIADERYPAWEWVEKHGGIDAVKRRTMPEGMEWPCFDDGEPVRIGDEYADTFGANTVATIEFGDGYSAINPNTPGGYVVGKCEGAHGRYVPRPAPKVLDADGAEIRVGDKLYDTETGCGRTVRAINANGTIEFDGHGDRGWFANRFTHERPVLAADGKPLREGEMVWFNDEGHKIGFVANGEPLKVLGLRGKRMVGVLDQDDIAKGYAIPWWFAPSCFTHERPDSWERIEADCMQDAKDYCEEHGIEPEYPKHIGKAKCEDLVRRARALAERDGS